MDDTRQTRTRLPRVLIGVLIAGLAIRVAVLSATSNLGPKIADEVQYIQLATSLVHGDGFAWGPGRPTSLRPPLYPAMVAAVWTVTGAGNLPAIRVLQIVLSLATAALVYELGRRVFNPSVGGLAAAITWLYPSLIFLNFTILTETLFTCLLVAFTLLAVMLVQQPRGWIAIACGIALGLGALTRSVLWPVPLLLCPLLLFLLRGPLGHRVLLSALVFAGYVMPVAPWAVRNTRLQGVVTIVDTMGGMNLRMGNYEYTPEDRMWDAVSLEGDQNWIHGFTGEFPGQVVTEGHKDKWGQRKAIEYMRAHPGTTIRRSLIKFGDFWGLERELVAGVQQGLYSPPMWFVASGAAVILLSYVAIALLGGAALWLTTPDWRAHVLLLLPVVIITGVHSIVFGHSRYHIPLVPTLAVYTAELWQAGPIQSWRRARWGKLGAAATVLVLAAAWGRQILVVDAARVRAFLGGVL